MHDTIGWGIAAGGLGVSIVGTFARWKWPQVSHGVADAGLGVGLTLILWWAISVTWGNGMAPVWVMGGASALLAVGALLYYLNHSAPAAQVPTIDATPTASAPSSVPATSVDGRGQGGKGGDATAIGDNSHAVAGRGGRGGTGGRGGDGGSGYVVGNNARVYGGEGGEAGQPDGSGGRGGRAGGDVGANIMGSIVGNQGIITQGQVGDNTIVQTARARYRLIENVPLKDNPDGSVTIGMIIEVIADSPPANLGIRVRGNGVTSLQVDGLGSGFVTTESGRMGEWFVEKIQAPYGRYRINVTSTQRDVNPEMEIAFNK